MDWSVVAPFAMPAWLIGLLPVINYGLNEAIIRLAPQMSGQDKRNLVRAVSITVVVGLLLFRAVSLPAPLPTSMLIEDWAPWVLLLLGLPPSLSVSRYDCGLEQPSCHQTRSGVRSQVALGPCSSRGDCAPYGQV